ncbi:fluoride efflux transporter CrcB [Methylobrevis albus]|uniref:Fluoride-specific ion channel FluC n=1 Tax=Methylobrevis albus TaxID=2793297 RepID=A0A931MZ49_9HYPH|nr:fluoride efflux transporter CrcB [Methylobrevis albus]MBH0237639.1 fluoride efflux transporter CrcB [Methylobrevis albus]
MAFLYVFLGAGLGGMARHGVNLLALRAFGGALPVGTFAVNVLGSLAMGLIAGLFALKAGAPQGLRLFLTTGILGGFTTFSAFSLDVAVLAERGEPVQALAYAVLSVVLSIGALFLGLFLARHVL